MKAAQLLESASFVELLTQAVRVELNKNFPAFDIYVDKVGSAERSMFHIHPDTAVQIEVIKDSGCPDHIWAIYQREIMEQVLEKFAPQNALGILARTIRVGSGSFNIVLEPHEDF